MNKTLLVLALASSCAWAQEQPTTMLEQMGNVKMAQAPKAKALAQPTLAATAAATNPQLGCTAAPGCTLLADFLTTDVVTSCILKQGGVVKATLPPVSNVLCQWSGQVFPAATNITLTAAIAGPGGTSPDSIPFVFDSVGTPTAPTNLRITKP